MFKNRVVQFGDGKFGVQVKRGLFALISKPEFASFGGVSESFVKPEYVNKYCKTNNLEEAQGLLAKTVVSYTKYKPTTEKQLMKYT